MDDESDISILEYQRVEREIRNIVIAVIKAGFGSVNITIRDGTVRFIDPTIANLVSPEVYPKTKTKKEDGKVNR